MPKAFTSMDDGQMERMIGSKRPILQTVIQAGTGKRAALTRSQKPCSPPEKPNPIGPVGLNMIEPRSSRRMRKKFKSALTKSLSQQLPGTVKINALCPGWVRTRMGGPTATTSVEDGADTAIWLATLPDDGPTGGFFRRREAIAW